LQRKVIVTAYILFRATLLYTVTCMLTDQPPMTGRGRFFPPLDVLCFFHFFVLFGFSCTRYNSSSLSIPRELWSLPCFNPTAPSPRLLLLLPLHPLLPRRHHVGESICLSGGYT